MIRLLSHLAIVTAVAAGCLLAPSAAVAQDTAREGIHVQGDWVIEVRNPDGSLADRREFSNDLVNPQVLAWALASGGDAAIGEISLDDCTENGGSVFGCVLPATSNWDAVAGPLDAVRGQSGPASLVLEASVTVAAPTVGTITIRDVGTRADLCVAADADCAEATGTPVTSTTLASPVDVTDGQTVIVTVTLTFS